MKENKRQAIAERAHVIYQLVTLAGRMQSKSSTDNHLPLTAYYAVILAVCYLPGSRL